MHFDHQDCKGVVMVFSANVLELNATKISDLQRRVLLYTGGRVENLRILIVNEEQIVLQGITATGHTKRLAEIAVLEVLPYAEIRNAIKVVPLSLAQFGNRYRLN
jgi:hypothetical protein